MIRFVVIVFLAALHASLVSAQAAPPPVTKVATAVKPADCLPCHEDKTAEAVRQWRLSAHGRAGVGCEECHGRDHAAIDKGEAPVGTATCGRCHEKAFHEHTASRHAMGLHSGWGCTRNLADRNPAECRFCHEEGTTLPKTRVQCARFLKQSAEMREIGCNRCHRIESSCAGCHGNHLTDLAVARDPKICATCHMGPDHPQWEMWETSRHGILFASAGAAVGPSCQRCHMNNGSHNVSLGITATPGGAPFPAAQFKERRAQMEAVCNGCHAPAYARRDLLASDAVRDQSTALTREADAVVRDCDDRGLLDPKPSERPPHPFANNTLVIDSQMLYEDTSHIERLLFKMKKYDWAKAVKGAYHQNPAYTHWYGNAELKMDLIDIRAEASRLKQRGAPAATVTAGTAGTAEKRVEEELRVLKRRFERGELSEADYAAARAKVLKGLP